MKKKLIEVALPLEAINDACKADKNRKTGTVRNLHKWFAPMPPPAWRALLFASVIDDPGEEEERLRLLRLIEGICPSDGSTPSELAVAQVREELKKSTNGELPEVLDPFCGAGTTALEAQRLGLPAIACDLNPVPVVITRFLVSVLPEVAGTKSLHGKMNLDSEHGLEGFVADVRYYAQKVRDAAFASIGEHYPLSPNGDPVIAWRWARTVQSPDPRFARAQTPLVGDWWLSKKKGLRAFVMPEVDHNAKTVGFRVETGDGEQPPPSKGRCLLSGAPLSFEYLREEGRAGRLGLALMAMISHGEHGRAHFAPSEEQIRAASGVIVSDAPDAPLPHKGLGFRVQEYGLTSWMDIFTPRQQLGLTTFADFVSLVPGWARDDGADETYAKALGYALGLCVGKLASFSSSQSLWRLDSRNGSGKAEAAFGRAVLPMTFDFVETNPFGGSVGDWMQVVDTAVRSFSNAVLDGPKGAVFQRDARSAADLVGNNALVATDPPYFDQIGYSDLSDYFYLWLRRAMKDLDPELFSTIIAPKAAELISDPDRHEGDDAASKRYFIDGFAETFHRLRERSSQYPLLIVYAFKQQETGPSGQSSTGWEALLEALLEAGLSVAGTWPVHGTGSTRQRAQASNALATYVVLVCRQRPENAPLASRREFHQALREALVPALVALQSAAIAPVDLAQAAIGPGMGVFSSYAKVVEADGTRMSVRSALSAINQVLDELLSEQETDFDADTRWAVSWFEEAGMEPGPFGRAETLSRAKNTSIAGLVQAGLLESRAGTARLLRRDELDEHWDPAQDNRLTVWEVAQHLIRVLDEDGEEAAARLLNQVGGLGETARDLAYRLYSICERRKWAAEGASYNMLAVAWPELVRLASTVQHGTGEQTSLGV